jgi:hypothetical protein
MAAPIAIPNVKSRHRAGLMSSRDTKSATFGRIG